jgi:hypothetical protein
VKGYGSPKYAGHGYNKGDVVGCCIDWESESLSFSLNGKKLGKFVHVKPLDL